MQIHVVPLLFGDGARLFENLPATDSGLTQVRAIEGPGVTHIKYRILKRLPAGERFSVQDRFSSRER